MWHTFLALAIEQGWDCGRNTIFPPSHVVYHGGGNRRPTSDDNKCRRTTVVTEGKRNNKGFWSHLGAPQGFSAQLSLEAEQESPRLGCEVQEKACWAEGTTWMKTLWWGGESKAFHGKPGFGAAVKGECSEVGEERKKGLDHGIVRHWFLQKQQGVTESFERRDMLSVLGKRSSAAPIRAH